MNQAVKPKSPAGQPTLQEQIDFMHRCRSEALVLRTSEHADMFKLIEENLIAIKRWNKTFIDKMEEGSKEVCND